MHCRIFSFSKMVNNMTVLINHTQAETKEAVLKKDKEWKSRLSILYLLIKK